MSNAAAAWAPKPALQRTATTALVLGVLNVVCFGPLTGVPAIVLGLRSWSAGWRAQLAVGLGVIGSVFWVLALIDASYPWFVHAGW